MTTPPQPTPGWYPDPATGRQRWWDGTAWSIQSPSLPPQQQLGAEGLQPKSSLHRWSSLSHKAQIGSVAGILALLLLIITVIVVARSPRYSEAEKRYLHALHDPQPGAAITAPWEDDATLLRQGYAICKALRVGDYSGQGPYDIDQELGYPYPRLQIDYQIGAAVGAFCDDQHRKLNGTSP